MRYLNEDDVVDQLRNAGLIFDVPLKASMGGSKRSVRCLVDGGDTEKRGWYRIYEWDIEPGQTMLVGSFGVWQGDDPGTQKVELSRRCEQCGTNCRLKDKTCSCGGRAVRRALTPEQKLALKARQEEDKRRAAAERQAEINRAAQWAGAVWRACSDAGPGDHDYLARKKLTTTGGARLFPGIDGIMLDGAEKEDYQYLTQFAGALVVPMCDERGQAYGLQFILSRQIHKARIERTERDKEYWPAGMSKQGRYHLVGGTPGRIGLVVEGYATGMSLHEATGLPVTIAFDAGNLGPVVTHLHKHYRKRPRWLICADDDWLQKCRECKAYTPVADAICRHCGKAHGKTNAGVARAADAALAVDGAWVTPNFAAERPADRKGPTDFNDLHAAEGLAVVRAQIEAKLADLGWPLAAGAPPGLAAIPARSAGGDPGGGGERRSAVAVLSLDEAVARFIPIDDGSGKYLWDTWTKKIVLREQMSALLPAKVRGDDVKQHPEWIRRGGYYLHEIGFDPTGKDASVRLNSWDGWPTVPRKGGCQHLLDLLRHQCGAELVIADALYQWLLRWLAYPIQHPGAKMQTAVIMHGPQGTGKGRFFEWGYMPIFGKYGVYLDQDALEDKHGSDWQSCKLFVLADEVLARAEMYHHKNKLKNLVTSRRIRINPKGLVAFEENNHLNVVFLSNEKQPLVLETDDRRYCVIWTPPPLSRAFYDDLSEELAGGGVEALHHHLRHEVDLGDFRPWTPPPLTQAKRDLIDLGRDSVDRFLLDWRRGDTDLPFCPCSSADLYRAYLAWCRANGEFKPRPENQFSGHVKKLHGWEKDHKNINMEDAQGNIKPHRQRVIIPSIEALNEAAVRGEDHRQRDGETQTKWLTTCFFTFRQALGVAA